MWSEHCSYKSSRVHLKTFPTTGPRVLQGPGENAGVVDLGDGLAAAFKMESHNHPSYIEPYQGAATGVGGILRDVFTMGARPIASLNSLRFGDPSHPKTAYLLEGVVAGIGGYGNCMGVPTVGGEVMFHPSYNGNCLVNAFTLGILPADKIFRGTAAGVGNPVMYIGAKTGRDGIHGATMASAEFDASTEEKRPTVQVGDPFMEKLLLEACLELFKTDAVVGIQDMGAAGLTSSSVEMAGRGGNGLDLFLDQVPLREEGMTPYEILLSESQERMLLVAAEGKEDEVRRICEKWDLDVAVIGRVTDSGRWRAHWHGQVGGGPAGRSAHRGAPKYERPMTPHPALPGAARVRRLLAPRAGGPGRGAARAAGAAHHRVEGVGLPAVRPHGPAGRRGPPRRRRRGGAPRGRRRAPRRQGHRALGRRQLAAGASSTRTSARSTRWPSAPATSPAWAASPSRSPTASTSATPRSRRSCGSSPSASAAWATPAARSARRSCRGTSRSTTRPRGRGSSPRRPWAWSGSSSRWTATCQSAFRNAGDVIALVGTHPGRGRRLGVPRRRARQGGGPPARARPREGEGGAGDGAPRGARGAALLRPRLLRRRPGGGAGRVLHDARRAPPTARAPAWIGAAVRIPFPARKDFVLFGEDASRILVSLPKEHAARLVAHLHGVRRPGDPARRGGRRSPGDPGGALGRRRRSSPRPGATASRPCCAGTAAHGAVATAEWPARLAWA